MVQFYTGGRWVCQASEKQRSVFEMGGVRRVGRVGRGLGGGGGRVGPTEVSSQKTKKKVE